MAHFLKKTNHVSTSSKKIFNQTLGSVKWNTVPSQWDQIGLFWQVIGIKFQTKVAQMLRQLLELFKKYN